VVEGINQQPWRKYIAQEVGDVLWKMMPLEACLLRAEQYQWAAS